MVYQKYTELVNIAQKQFRQDPRCVLCGKLLDSNNKTKEHLPPRQLIADTNGVNFITVPACYQCNNSSSEADTQFRNMLALWLYNQPYKTEEAEKLIKICINSLGRASKSYIKKYILLMWEMVFS